MNPMSKLLPVVCLAGIASILRAEVRPNPLFTDNAVLQQGMSIPVWGTASTGEKVTVEFAGQKVSTTATNGSWSVRLQPVKADTNPAGMIISGVTNTVTVTNLLVGEVWICSGQSNMERQLGPRRGQKPIVNWEAEVNSANYPLIRHFLVKNNVSTSPVSMLSGEWRVCSPKTVANFTAVGYFFGRDLQTNIKIPIGLIHSSWGGTPAEAWTSAEALAGNPILIPMLNRYSNAVANYPSMLAKFQSEEPKLKADYSNACALAVSQGKPSPRPPVPPSDPSKYQNNPTSLFNGMIYPLLPYAIRGVIWYQGESNGTRGKEYQTLFPTMIADWRTRWGEGDFPFIYVQVAPFNKMPPEIREAQFLTLKKSTNTAMVVITDHGDANDIHPAEKQPVGERLALAARVLAYGQEIEYSGPLFKNAEFRGTNAFISFSHSGKGLISKGGNLRGFEISGDDSKFVPANAVISGTNIIVSAPGVTTPTSVRFGWGNVPDVNLFNEEGLPASPFRSNPH
jgi:sialate O-acetylesterase